ncbi:LysR family transcriptional regulator [Cupriavidus sp. YR651]|uniref:LysR family transcriptional regulator n=1 Tax=Cupriavidus sp. YR651 TaxID=1855315 RepID=UPI000B866245|nr:LysR family transcriptional regulator [Cupriavidus sp. YR651]
MELADLKNFEVVAQLGIMNRANTELHTVQSNITARIRGLEEELGTQLFERHARGVRPTPAGQRILPFVARIGKLMAEARTAAQDDGVPSGTLHSPSASSVVPQGLRFSSNNGGVRKDRTGRQLNGRTYDEMPKVRRTTRIELAA